MKVPAMIAAELRRLTSSRMGIIALIALVCVPILYGGLYLWANQDPYAASPMCPWPSSSRTRALLPRRRASTRPPGQCRRRPRP